MNVNSTELREVSTDELRSVEGGWCSITCRNIMDLMADRGDTPSTQETWVASLPPSRKP